MPIVNLNAASTVSINDYQLNGRLYDQYRREYKEKGNQDLYNGLGGSTSDHAYRVVEVKSEIEEMTLQVATYNMLGRAKKNEGSYNNPLATTEDDIQYAARKHSQILILVEILTRNPPPDVLCLQEADWAFIDGGEIQNEVRNILHTLGYAMIVTEGADQQPLVTLYNTKTLDHNEKDESGMLPSSENKNRAYGCVFTHKGSKKQVAICNAHLEYKEDYKSNNKLQNALDTAFPDMLAIVAGDLNHNLSEEMPYAITTKEASVVSAKKNKDDKPTLTLEDDKTKAITPHKQTAYDAFCVRPRSGVGDTTARIVGGQQITIKDNKAQFQSLSAKKKTRSIYTGGKLYENEKIELLKLDKELGSSPDQKNFIALHIESLLSMRRTREGKRDKFTDQFLPQLVNYNAYKKNPASAASGLPAAGAQVVTSTSPSSSAAGVAAKAAAVTNARRILRNNIDALQVFLEANEKNPIAILGLIAQLKASKRDKPLMVDKENYVIVNQAMIDAANAVSKPEDFKDIIYTQINAYVTDKQQSMKSQGKNDSRLLKGYANMRSAPDTDEAKKFKEEMHGKAQVKKWTLTDDLPPAMVAGLSGKTRFVGFTQASPGKSPIKDLVKIYENSQVPVFASNEDLANKLNSQEIVMNIDGKDYFIRGKIKNDIVVFVKCAGKGDHPMTGMSISEDNVESFKKANQVESFSIVVMQQLGQVLKKDPKYKDVEFKAPDKPKPPATTPKST